MCCIFGGGFYNNPYCGGPLLFGPTPRIVQSIYHGQCQSFSWGLGFGAGVGLMNLTGALLNRWF